MEAGDVIELLKLLEQQEIGVVVDGGWGVDALLGSQTRPHDETLVDTRGKRWTCY